MIHSNLKGVGKMRLIRPRLFCLCHQPAHTLKYPSHKDNEKNTISEITWGPLFFKKLDTRCAQSWYQDAYYHNPCNILCLTKHTVANEPPNSADVKKSTSIGAFFPITSPDATSLCSEIMKTSDVWARIKGAALPLVREIRKKANVSIRENLTWRLANVLNEVNHYPLTGTKDGMQLGDTTLDDVLKMLATYSPLNLLYLSFFDQVCPGVHGLWWHSGPSPDGFGRSELLIVTLLKIAAPVMFRRMLALLRNFWKTCHDSFERCASTK